MPGPSTDLTTAPDTHRRSLHCLSVADLTVIEARHGGGLRLRAHEHELACVYFPLAGHLRETVERRSFELEPGAALVKPGGARHSNHYGPEEVVGMLVEVPTAAQDRLGLVELFDDRRLFSDGESARIARHLAAELRAADSSRLLGVEALTYELLGRLSRAPAIMEGRPSWLARIRSQIADEPQLGASLETLAMAAGRHPSHVAREFRRAYGTTIGEYSRRRRIEVAAVELHKSSESIAEIALRAGFYDQSHFSNAFRKSTGMTPGEYRRSGRSAAGRPAAQGRSKTS